MYPNQIELNLSVMKVTKIGDIYMPAEENMKYLRNLYGRSKNVPTVF